MKLRSGINGPNETWSEFSIERTSLDRWAVYQGDTSPPAGYEHYVASELRIRLKPKPQVPGRGMGSSYETKKYPAELIIKYEELYEMLRALEQEIELSHRMLCKHKLLEELNGVKSEELTVKKEVDGG